MCYNYFDFKNQLLDMCLLVMSPSRNFPARAEPSCEGSEPSRAELGHFNFRAETELTSSTPQKGQNYLM